MNRVLKPAYEVDRVTPGEVIREQILEENGLTQGALADALGVTRYSVNQLVNNRRSVTPEMACRLARATRTSAEFWLNLQQAVDLQRARRRLERSNMLNKVRVVRMRPHPPLREI